jgi:hypothetical protein
MVKLQYEGIGFAAIGARFVPKKLQQVHDAFAGDSALPR